ncbi:uncharacterized protein VTP21DRAFT_8061 [Calcarisporiella thermophila]|uniref:uncharacterized protein n=1 Tax=Calcarisporiella thermophila TaxID=911321 RepID=UPI0037430A22
MPPITKRSFILYDILNDKICRKACLACRQKKVKCDGNLEGCSRCKILNIQCLFVDNNARRGRPPRRLTNQNEHLLFNTHHPQNSLRSGLCGQVWMIVQKLDPYISSLGIKPICFNKRETGPWKWTKGVQFTHSPGNKMMTSDMLAIIIEKMNTLSKGTSVMKNFPYVNSFEAKNDIAPEIPPEPKNPFQSLSYDQAIMLINAWFKLHPFSPILNRTIVLQNYREQRYDSFLYSTLFASALSLMGLPVFDQTKSGLPGSEFTEYALFLLERQESSVSLTKLQGVFIMGCHLIYRGQSKMGIPLLATAWKMASELRIPEQDSETFDQVLIPVERELRTNLWWAMRISYTWGYLHIRSRLDHDMFLSTIKLPVKDYRESVLYALDKCHGHVIQLQETAQAIRSFYNSAFLTNILSDIWTQIAPPTEFQSLFVPDKSEPACSGPRSVRHYLLSLHSTISTLEKSISAEPASTESAELLLYLNVLIIHSLFQTTDDSGTLFIQTNALMECIKSADKIMDLAESVCDDQMLHSIVVFGLNTCISVYSLVAQIGTNEEQVKAIRNLRDIMELLASTRPVCYDLRMMRKLEDFVAHAEKHQGVTSPSMNGDRQILVPAEIPRVSLRSLARAGDSDETGQGKDTLLAMLVSNNEQPPSMFSPEPSFFTSLPLAMSDQQHLQQDLGAHKELALPILDKLNSSSTSAELLDPEPSVADIFATEMPQLSSSDLSFIIPLHEIIASTFSSKSSPEPSSHASPLSTDLVMAEDVFSVWDGNVPGNMEIQAECDTEFVNELVKCSAPSEHFNAFVGA